MTGWPLRTPRLVIRSAVAADLPELARIVTLPQVAGMLFLFRSGMTTAELALHFPLDTTARPFRAVITREGQVAGSIGVGSGESPPIWYFLDPAVSGAGLGSEAAAAFVGWLDGQGVGTLTAEVFTDNPASRRVLERIGFAVVGQAQRQSAARPAPAPVWQMQRG